MCRAQCWECNREDFRGPSASQTQQNESCYKSCLPRPVQLPPPGCLWEEGGGTRAGVRQRSTLSCGIREGEGGMPKYREVL